jgi:hypothetical protein
VRRPARRKRYQGKSKPAGGRQRYIEQQDEQQNTFRNVNWEHRLRFAIRFLFVAARSTVARKSTARIGLCHLGPKSTSKRKTPARRQRYIKQQDEQQTPRRPDGGLCRDDNENKVRGKDAGRMPAVRNPWPRIARLKAAATKASTTHIQASASLRISLPVFSPP